MPWMKMFFHNFTVDCVKIQTIVILPSLPSGEPVNRMFRDILAGYPSGVSQPLLIFLWPKVAGGRSYVFMA